MNNFVSSKRQTFGCRTRSLDRNAILLVVFVLIFVAGLLCISAHAEARAQDNHTGEPDWSELIASMEKMHTAMGAIERSGNADVDFVRLMLPHHQAAIDMAKAQLLYGQDAQMRRLAQEIVTDQQLEIELMQRWLKKRTPANEAQKNN